MIRTLYETEDGIRFEDPRDAAKHENGLRKLDKCFDILSSVKKRGCLTRLTSKEQEEIDEFIASLEEFLTF